MGILLGLTIRSYVINELRLTITIVSIKLTISLSHLTQSVRQYVIGTVSWFMI